MFRRTHHSTDIENEMSSHAHHNTTASRHATTKDDPHVAAVHDEGQYDGVNARSAIDEAEYVDLTRQGRREGRVGLYQPRERENRIDRQVRVDRDTNAQQYYENDGRGTQKYGYYYNSDNDPNFRRQHGDDAHAACYYFSTTSTGTAPTQARLERRPRVNRVQVREDAGDDASETRHTANSTSSHTSNTRNVTAQPIVEEPDDEEVERDARQTGGRVTRPRDELAVRDAAMQDPFMSMHDNMMSMMRQHMQDMHTAFFGRSRGGLLSDPFFDDMNSAPFDQMSRQRAHLFGNDPFERFFRD